MGAIDDIKRMQSEGKSEQEIMTSLRERGISDREISDALAQTKIKDAVSSNNSASQEQKNAGGSNIVQESGQTAMTGAGQGGVLPAEQSVTGQSEVPLTEEYEGMQPSMLASQGQESYPSDAYSGGGYSQYQPYQEGLSSDVITEISEQVVDERLASIQDMLEKSIDFRNTSEAKISGIDERLKRIEQIIDRLQLSLLQKVGDYVSEVGDVRKELEETQKSFKALVPKMNKGAGIGKDGSSLP